MAKSNAERQREFKARHGDKFKRLDILLPINECMLLSGNASKLGISKAEYIIKLLHGNESKAVNSDSSSSKEVINKLLPDNRKQSKTPINCAYCKQQFTPRRSTAKFCSDKCRKINHRKQAL